MRQPFKLVVLPGRPEKKNTLPDAEQDLSFSSISRLEHPAGFPIHALCHEHHLGMKAGVLFAGSDPAISNLAFTCPEPGCFVFYSPEQGYFRVRPSGGNERKRLPRVQCSVDRQPMYLAEVDPEGGSSRVWRCPRCGSTRNSGSGVLNWPV